MDGSCKCTFVDTPFLSGSCGSGSIFFMTLVQHLLMSQRSISDPCNRSSDDAHLRVDEEFDFIVVGAGVAGPVVASRLSENPAWRVLLLEAGPNEPSVTSVPAFSMSAVGSQLDWKYVTENSTQACLSTGGRCKWPRGKMESGSSGMQGMMYTRPHRSIFDEWNKGNEDKPGWSFEDILPYYKKSETNLNPAIIDEEYHGTEGPMTIQQYPSKPSMCDDVVEAGKQLGYRNGDLNGRNQTGVAVAQMMVYEGLRMSTSKAYIRPYLHTRNNLKVLLNSQVTKILIDAKTKLAQGVEYVDKSGNTHTVYASKEVILSGGAVNSPQLLLLSGIGPRKDLQEVGIDAIVDLPGVGHNLLHHVGVATGFYMNNDEGTITLTSDAVMEYIRNRTGSLASTGLTQTTLFMLSKYATDGVPDIQMFFDAYGATCSKSGLPEECERTGHQGDCGKRHLVARPTNIRPLSKGYLKLKSSNPLDHPLIYPNYLKEQKDIDVLIDGIKLSIELAKSPALQKYNITVDTTSVKGCEGYTFGSDDYFECKIRMETGAENHQAGSCKMGPKDDPMAVVDHQLKVHGISNIRVVDASFFPVNPNCNPTSVIIMSAEKASDMIKETYPGR